MALNPFEPEDAQNVGTHISTNAFPSGLTGLGCLPLNIGSTFYLDPRNTVVSNVFQDYQATLRTFSH